MPPHLAERVIKEAQAAQGASGMPERAEIDAAAIDADRRAPSRRGRTAIAVPDGAARGAGGEAAQPVEPQSLYAQILQPWACAEKIKLALRGNATRA